MTLADILRPKPSVDHEQEAEKVPLEAPVMLSPKVIAVWGSAGSGKTTLAVNIAFEMSSMDLRVLIIDADSYRPSIAACLGLTEPGPGITALLRLARTSRLSIEELNRLTEEIQFGKKSLRVLTGLNAPSRWPELDTEIYCDTHPVFERAFRCRGHRCFHGARARPSEFGKRNL